MLSENQEVKKRFEELKDQPILAFPQPYKKLKAPNKPGVYIIWKGDEVLHVGRTLRGKNGLWQRLKNHLDGNSSFTKEHLKGKGATLRREGYTYQWLIVEDDRLRAFLEAFAIGSLCPKHIGLGLEGD